MRKLPLLLAALSLLTSCQYIPQFLMENPFAAKVVQEVVEDVVEEIAEELDDNDPVKPESSKDVLFDCPAHLKAI